MCMYLGEWTVCVHIRTVNSHSSATTSSTKSFNLSQFPSTNVTNTNTNEYPVDPPNSLIFYENWLWCIDDDSLYMCIELYVCSIFTHLHLCSPHVYELVCTCACVVECELKVRNCMSVCFTTVLCMFYHSSLSKHLVCCGFLKWFVSQWPYLVHDHPITPHITLCGEVTIEDPLRSCPLGWHLALCCGVQVSRCFHGLKPSDLKIIRSIFCHESYLCTHVSNTRMYVLGCRGFFDLLWYMYLCMCVYTRSWICTWVYNQSTISQTCLICKFWIVENG